VGERAILIDMQQNYKLRLNTKGGCAGSFKMTAEKRKGGKNIPIKHK
jgi:hypothetical protein